MPLESMQYEPPSSRERDTVASERVNKISDCWIVVCCLGYEMVIIMMSVKRIS